MRLTIEADRADGDWTTAAVYIKDGEVKFGLNPNQPRTIRIFHGENFRDFDLDRLELIHTFLHKAKTALAHETPEEGR